MSDKLNIILPGIVWQESADYPYLYKELKIPLFTKLLSKAKRTAHDFIYSDFIYPKISANTLAKQYASEIGFNSYKSYLIAEPTHLRADRDRLLIAESEILQISEDEAIQIIGDINKHFEGEIELRYFKDDLWVLGCNLDLDDLQSYSLLDVIGENADEFLPIGASRLKLHQIMNEIQMLLFNHSINQLRSEEGLVTINSLWFWDKSSNNRTPNLGKLISNNKIIGKSINNLAEDIYLCDSLLIDKAYYPQRYRDSFAWVQAVNELETKVIPLIINGLKSDKWSTIAIWLPLINQTYQFEISRLSLYKFWKNKNFEELSLSLVENL
ncbi:MAG: hypothetical protein PHC75_07285 [Burkholderiales bacterium]|nr:hypothetical protein [Burkholderiales bacterium]